MRFGAFINSILSYYFPAFSSKPSRAPFLLNVDIHSVKSFDKHRVVVVDDFAVTEVF